MTNDRAATFRALPGFEDYLSTMLQDLALTAADDGDERDTGTIYTLPESAFVGCKREYEAFVRAAGPDATMFIASQGADQFGSDFYMTRVGHGVGFWDRDAGVCGERLTALVGYGTAFPQIDAYFGDDGLVYVSGMESVQ